MNRRSLGIAGIFGVLALACGIQANAAKTIRQDMGFWNTCPLGREDESNPCTTLPDVSFDPFGLGQLPTAVTDVDNGRVFGTNMTDDLRELQYGWGSAVPGLDSRYQSVFGDAQVLYFGLGDGRPNDGDPVDLVYTPDYEFKFDGGVLSNPSTLENRPGTWEIAFNYNFNFREVPDPNAFFASLTWDGIVYSAPLSVLYANDWNTFVFYGADPAVEGSVGHLYVPKGWLPQPPSTSVPEPTSLALLFIGLAGLIGAHSVRRRRSIASLNAG